MSTAKKPKLEQRAESPSPSPPLPPPQWDMPLRVQFIITSLPVGGAETLLVNLIRRIDKRYFAPEVVCLKEPGELGEVLAGEVPLHSDWLRSKWDARIVFRLASHFRKRQADAVITVGAGDKMFWGRLAAKLAGVPFICSALHSTGWPDGIGTLNRWLTPITDAFIAVAKQHADHLTQFEKFPSDRVFMIPNGVDTDRFRPNHPRRKWLRRGLGLPNDCQLVGIVAALRKEKNHIQFVDAAGHVVRQRPNTHFLIIGDGPERAAIAAHIAALGLEGHCHMLGMRHDAPQILAGIDVFCLTSRNEANPVSILEALACGVPVVAPKVGSISETVQDHVTGLLTEPVCAESTSEAILELLSNVEFAQAMGLAGRQLVRNSWSLDAMVYGYQDLISRQVALKPKSRSRCAAAASRAAQDAECNAIVVAKSDPTPTADSLPTATASVISAPALSFAVSKAVAAVVPSAEQIGDSQPPAQAIPELPPGTATQAAPLPLYSVSHVGISQLDAAALSLDLYGIRTSFPVETVGDLALEELSVLPHPWTRTQRRNRQNLVGCSLDKTVVVAMGSAVGDGGQTSVFSTEPCGM